MEHIEEENNVDPIDTPTDKFDTSENQDPTPEPPNTESLTQQEFLSPWVYEAILEYKPDSPIPEECLEYFTSVSPPATNQDEGTTNLDTFNIDTPDFNAPFMPITGHPLNSLFSEVMNDFPSLPDDTLSGEPIIDWSKYDDHFADSAALETQETDVSNIDAADYEIGSHSPLEEWMSLSSHPDPPRSISNPAESSQTEEMGETGVFPYTNDFGDFLKRITVAEFEQALIECLTSQPGREIRLPVRGRS
ncbi:MAG: hypothetical protein Q9226_001644 [Calogaya cf. arnoldii]